MQFKFDVNTAFLNSATMHISQMEYDEDSFDIISEKELEAFKDKVKKPKTILDLGCGLGRMSVYLYHICNLIDSKFILADGNSFPPKINNKMFGFSRKKRFYNSLHQTRMFCEHHNLGHFELFNLEEKDISELSNIDFVMSFLSVGYHFPLEDYIHSLLKISSNDCVMVFGVREGLYLPNMFDHLFKSVEIRSIDYTSHGSDNEELLICSGKNNGI